MGDFGGYGDFGSVILDPGPYLKSCKVVGLYFAQDREIEFLTLIDCINNIEKVTILKVAQQMLVTRVEERVGLNRSVLLTSSKSFKKNRLPGVLIFSLLHTFHKFFLPLSLPLCRPQLHH